MERPGGGNSPPLMFALKYGERGGLGLEEIDGSSWGVEGDVSGDNYGSLCDRISLDKEKTKFIGQDTLQLPQCYLFSHIHR